ncbi:MAG: hydrogenase formation protein HypD, partial [Syntrophothermus sp.]
KGEFALYDAEKAFEFNREDDCEPSMCIAGEVLQGLKKPVECTAFGNQCTPLRPLGAPMVSSEGACAAYFNYKKT